jgi:cation diffusion facilitator CzcD-associated flavoprotein CzcO
VAKQAARLTSTSAAPIYVFKRNDRPYGTGRKSCSVACRSPRNCCALAVSTCAASGCSIRCCATGPAGCCAFWEKWCRDYREDEIADPDLRARLTPDYRLGCKRILISDDYYSAFQPTTRWSW